MPFPLRHSSFLYCGPERLVLENDVQRVNDARDVTEDLDVVSTGLNLHAHSFVVRTRQQDVDEEVSATAAFEEYSKRWEYDGEDDFDDVAVDVVSCCH